MRKQLKPVNNQKSREKIIEIQIKKIIKTSLY